MSRRLEFLADARMRPNREWCWDRSYDGVITCVVEKDWQGLVWSEQVSFSEGARRCSTLGAARRSHQLPSHRPPPASPTYRRTNPYEQDRSLNTSRTSSLTTVCSNPHSSWPTIPQLYVKGEFVGGCDIVLAMHQDGELEKLFIEAGVVEAVPGPGEAAPPS